MEALGTLDLLLLRVADEVSLKAAGALSENALNALLDEVLHLRVDRLETHHAFGYRDAVLQHAYAETLPGESREARLWYDAGYVRGLARVGNRHGAVAALLSRESVRALATSDSVPSRLSLRTLIQSCLAEEQYDQVQGLVTPTLLRTGGDLALEDLLSAAARLRDRKMPRQAEMLLRPLEANLLSTSPAAAGTSGEQYRRRVLHELALCARSLGEFARASELLAQLLSDSAVVGQERTRLLADKALADARFPRLDDVLLPDDEGHVQALRVQLSGSVSNLVSAAEGSQHAGAANYCLGVHALLSKDYSEAVRLLSLADLDADSLDPNTLSRCRLYVRTAAVLSLDVGGAASAAEGLAYELSTAGAFPLYLVAPVLESLGMTTSDEVVQRLADVFLKSLGDAALDEVLKCDGARGSEAVAEALLTRWGDSAVSDDDRAGLGASMLPVLLATARRDEAGQVLDALEGLALNGVATGKFLEMLLAPGCFEPAWSREEAFWSRVRVLSSAGDYSAAARMLELAFHRCLVGTEDYRLGEAEDILSEIQRLGIPAEQYEHLERRLEACLQTSRRAGATKETELVEPVRILVVGGNETQAQYDEQIQGECLPSIHVSFLHTGWGSNWQPYVDEVRRSLPETDALVLIRFMRTMFGRAVRAMCGGVPWIACTGSGRASILRAIQSAAELARRHIAQQGVAH